MREHVLSKACWCKPRVVSVPSKKKPSYHIPPDDYHSPSIEPGCLCCGQPVIFVLVIGGHRWVHLSEHAEADHDVKIGRWWDTRTGEWVEGDVPEQPEEG